MSDASQPLPTFESIIAGLQVLSVQQNGAEQLVQGINQVRDGLNAVIYAANTTLANALGQISDQIATLDARVSLRLGSIDSELFSLQQRINVMSDTSAQIAAGVATLKTDMEALTGVAKQTTDGLTALEAQFASAVSAAQARGTADAATIADLTALHQAAVAVKDNLAAGVASIPSAAPVSPPADPAPAPAPTDAPPADGSTGATAPAPSGDTGSTGATAVPAPDAGSTGATA